MRLDPDGARARFSVARVLRLATADRAGVPHLVPCTFAIDDAGRIVIGIDHKPKTTLNLRRLRNIEQNPRVSLLADEYDEDWNRLWWARADGTAAIEHGGAGHDAHWRQLRARYRQYDGQVPGGPVITVTADTWSGWAYSPAEGHDDDPASRTGDS
jgi:PPOX class probable F420-dependent enzyme